MELSTLRKNKINIHDYPYQEDIENRLLMAEFSTFDVEVLEEILFSPLKVPLKKLSRSLEATIEDLLPVINKLEKTHLLVLEDDILVVDKDKRKYFENEIQKFDEDFQPDMEYLQTLLKKVPIHSLPLWYSISRTSNNIFESIVEKYLLTPQVYQRYLMEVGNEDVILSSIIQDILDSDDCKVYAEEIREKYHLTKESLEEYILQLEFHFVASLSYAKVGKVWKEVITPFREWRDYLLFLKNNRPIPIGRPENFKEEEFPFIKEIASFLKKCKKEIKENSPFIDKLLPIKFLQKKEDKLSITDIASDWLTMDLENQALYLYRHPFNRPSFSSPLNNEKNLREIERSLKSFCSLGWINFDDYLQSALISFHDETKIQLRKNGKTWKYTLPVYSDEEKAFIQTSVLDYLYELGLVSKGTKAGKAVFRITSFGETILGN